MPSETPSESTVIREMESSITSTVVTDVPLTQMITEQLDTEGFEIVEKEALELESYDIVLKFGTGETITQTIELIPSRPASEEKEIILHEAVPEESTVVPTTQVTTLIEIKEEDAPIEATQTDTLSATVVQEDTVSQTSSLEVMPDQPETTTETTTETIMTTQESVPTAETAIVVTEERPQKGVETHLESITITRHEETAPERFESAMELHSSHVQMAVTDKEKITAVVPTEVVEVEDVAETQQQRRVSELAVPQLVTGLRPELVVMDGESMVLQCQFDVRPMKEAVWYHENEAVAENEDITLYQVRIAKLNNSEIAWSISFWSGPVIRHLVAG